MVCILYSVVFRDPPLVFNPPETKNHNHIFVEFHCLLDAQQWGFTDTSNVFIRFAAPEFGGFNNCYGPMQKVNRFVHYTYLYCCNSSINKYKYVLIT